MDIDINIHEAEFALAHLHDWIKPRRGTLTDVVAEVPSARAMRRCADDVPGDADHRIDRLNASAQPLRRDLQQSRPRPRAVVEALRRRHAAVVAETSAKLPSTRTPIVITRSVPEPTALLDQPGTGSFCMAPVLQLLAT